MPSCQMSTFSVTLAWCKMGVLVLIRQRDIQFVEFRREIAWINHSFELLLYDVNLFL